jgi:hypothetical protein
MIIELIKEVRVAQDDWYSVTADGKYIIGSSDAEKAEKLYQSVLQTYKNNKKDEKIVLKSEEIHVSL